MKKYTCPMHLQVLKDEPGKCPICGMELVPFGAKAEHSQHHKDSKEHQNHSESGFDKHEGHHTSDFIKRFWVSLALTVPILLLSHMIQEWLGFKINFPGDRYVLMALGTAIYIYGGMPFLKGMVGEIKSKAI
ncbi:MAG: heavy metal-binding domain-containing protein [Saprospiraceae bacterium]